MLKKISFIISILLVFTAFPYQDVLAAEHEVVVLAGAESRDNCPVSVTICPKKVEDVENLAVSSWKLVNENEEIPAMVVKSAQENKFDLVFIVNGLSAYEKRVYQLVPGDLDSDNAVDIEHEEEAFDITIGDKPFSTYIFAVDKKQPRPIFYPLFGPEGAAMTRGFPMDYHEGERKDHPHHQSLWVSHGDVNGHNFWHLGDEQGYQKMKKVNFIESGPVCGRFSVINDWVSEKDEKVLEEKRVVTIWGTPQSGRMIDFDITLTATDEDVKFGDTKEGGLVSLRVAGSMREEQESGKKGGTITNFNGDAGAGEAWGKQSPWCDYSGPVNGMTAGLTIMDHPLNPFYPTYYHVRDYGLFTANPFGLSYFKRNKDLDGSQVLENGESWHCRYRVYVHTGDVKSGNVSQAYANYADAPIAVLH